MSRYYNNYSLLETSANEGLSERNQLEGHLYLGTAKLQFWNSDGQVSDSINILDQFYLRVMVWNGKYDKHGNLKYEFSSELSDIVFEDVLKKKGYFQRSDVARLSKIAKKSNKVKEFTFFVDEWNAYDNDGKNWGNTYADKNSSIEESNLEEFLSCHPYFTQYNKADVLSPCFTMFRKGMNDRYYAKHGKEFKFNKYLADYWSYIKDMGIGEDGVITTEMFKKLFLGGTEFAYMSLPLAKWNSIEKGKFFLNIANSWTHLSTLNPRFLKDDKFVDELLCFNPKIPTFLLSEYLSKRENMIHYLENIYGSSDMSAISPDIVTKWHDDEEVSHMIMEGLSYDMAERSRVYSLFSDRVKIIPSILKNIDGKCFKHIPKSYLEKEENVIDLLSMHPPHGYTNAMLRALPKAMRENFTILRSICVDSANHNKAEHRLPLSMFSKKFIEELREIGAKVDEKGGCVIYENYYSYNFTQNDLAKFGRHTRAVIYGLVEYDVPCKLGQFSLVWKRQPEDSLLGEDVDLRDLMKKKKVGCLYSSSHIYINEELIDRVRTKRFADKLTVDLEVAKPTLHTTKSGRSKI